MMTPATTFALFDPGSLVFISDYSSVTIDGYDDGCSATTAVRSPKSSAPDLSTAKSDNKFRNPQEPGAARAGIPWEMGFQKLKGKKWVQVEGNGFDYDRDECGAASIWMQKKEQGGSGENGRACWKSTFRAGSWRQVGGELEAWRLRGAVAILEMF